MLIGVVNSHRVNLVLVRVVQHWNRQEGIVTRCDVQSSHVVTGPIVEHLAHDLALLGFTDHFDFTQALVLEPLGLTRVFDRGTTCCVSHGHLADAVNSQLLAKIGVLGRSMQLILI